MDVTLLITPAVETTTVIYDYRVEPRRIELQMENRKTVQTMNKSSRRTFLERSLTGVTVGLATVSGCLGRATNWSNQADEVSIPEPSVPSYRRWLPEPGSVGPTDHDYYRAQYYSLTELRANPDRKLSTFHRKRVRDETGFLDLGDSADELIRLSGIDSMRAYVVMGSYDADGVEESVRQNGFSDARTYGEYSILRRTDPARVVAVSDSAVLYGKHDDAAGLVEAIIDAAEGNRPRYHEVDERFASLTEAVGESAVTEAETTEPAPHTNPEILQFKGSVGHATGRSLADGTEYVRHAIEFTEQADDHVETVRETVGDDESFAAVEVFADEKTVFVDGELDESN